MKRIAGVEQRTFCNSINKDDFLIFPAGSACFTRWRPMQRACPVSDPDWEIGVTWDVEYTLSWRTSPGGWNSIYDQGDPQNGFPPRYDYVSREVPPVVRAPGTVPDDGSLYLERDFRSLFKVQA